MTTEKLQGRFSWKFDSGLTAATVATIDERVIPEMSRVNLTEHSLSFIDFLYVK